MLSCLRLEECQNYYIDEKINFKPSLIDVFYLKQSFRFSFDMTFGEVGEHRSKRSGGTHHRKRGEIFCDTFQGKLSEFIVCQKLNSLGVSCSLPDTDKWGLGSWDNADFIVDDRKVNVKSMSYFSNLLLLETKDWDRNGVYIPDNQIYDFFIVVRIKPDLKQIFRSKKLLYSSNLDKEFIQDLIEGESFTADIPGYVDNKIIKVAINNDHILPQNSLLNGKTRMDAENYYVMSCDFEDINNINQDL